MSLLLWEESRLQSNGVVTTYVVSLKSNKDYVCRRQNQKEAQGVLAKCQQSGLTTLAELKKFVKTLRKEDILAEPAVDVAALFSEASNVASSPGPVAQNQVKEPVAIQEAAACHVAAAEDAVPLVAPPAVPAAVTEQKDSAAEGEAAVVEAPDKNDTEMSEQLAEGEAAAVETPDKKDTKMPATTPSFEKQVWGRSPVKRRKISDVDAEKLAIKVRPGNPFRLVHEKQDRCSMCDLEKAPTDMPPPREKVCKSGRKMKVTMSHHGARCHFCHTKLQFFARKYGVKSRSSTAYTELQLGHIKAESVAWRKEVLGHE